MFSHPEPLHSFSSTLLGCHFRMQQAQATYQFVFPNFMKFSLAFRLLDIERTVPNSDWHLSKIYKRCLPFLPWAYNVFAFSLMLHFCRMLERHQLLQLILDLAGSKKRILDMWGVCHVIHFHLQLLHWDVSSRQLHLLLFPILRNRLMPLSSSSV